jgi:membrane associated rhomboid family serine protease
MQVNAFPAVFRSFRRRRATGAERPGKCALKAPLRSSNFAAMLDDRSYMRGDPHRPGWSASITLIIVLTVVYALQCIDDVYIRSGTQDYLAMSAAALKHLWLWQLVTFQFLHLDLWHLIGNLCSLWFFGRYVEGVLGTKRFLLAYFIAGCAGGLVQGTLMVLFPEHFGVRVFGASAGTSGIFAIFAMMESHAEIRWNFILPIRARVLFYIVAGISLFFTLVPTPRESVAHAAHLGGIIAGVCFLRWDATRVSMQWNPFSARRRKRQLVQAASKSLRSRPRERAGSPPAELPSEEFISREVDPILDKISAHGIHSLTPREREILEAARAKMAKR